MNTSQWINTEFQHPESSRHILFIVMERNTIFFGTYSASDKKFLQYIDSENETIGETFDHDFVPNWMYVPELPPWRASWDRYQTLHDKSQYSDGIIKTDSIIGQVFGLTSNKFASDSYLWKDGNMIILSLIIAKHRGAFRTLIETITNMGFTFQIPTPSARIQEIALKQGWHFRQVLMDGEQINVVTNVP